MERKTMAKPSEIRTKRLLILPFNENHLHQKYVGWLNDPELMRYSEQRHKTHDLENCRTYWKSFEGTPNYFWAIEELKFGLGHIGNITAYVDEKNLLADVGILIGERKAHNKHYGLEAWLGVCNYLFESVNIRKLTAGTLSLNEPMLKIMKRAHMIEDGIRKKHFLVDNQEVDIIHKAIFRDQWKMTATSSHVTIL
jgi:RimJ/RimL family protein N-acetyltransferase